MAIATAPRRLVLGASSRLVADLAGVGLGMVSAVITARALGTAGKGVLASLTYTVSIAAHVATLGLGQAFVVLAGQKRFERSRAIRATWGFYAVWLPVVIAGAAAALVLELRSDASTLAPAIAIVCAGIVPTVSVDLVLYVLQSREELVRASGVLFLMPLVTTSVLVTLFAFGALSVSSAVIAGPVASTVALFVAAAFAGREALGAPRSDAEYLRSALRLGLPLQAASMLMTLSARFDLLLVLGMLGRSEAGIYSVSLTLGTLVASGPAALAYALFPRIANSGESTLALGPLLRFAILVSVATAAGFAVLAPVVVPVFFGKSFAPAVVPYLVMSIGSVVWSAQWILCRAEAARGRVRPYLVSFGASVLAMVGFDLLFIPRWGLLGAALGSDVGPLAGLVACLLLLPGFSAKELVLSRADLQAPIDFIARWWSDRNG